MILAAKTRTKWDVKREASRAALLDAAMRSFAERGYAATTVADIAGPAGHTSGAFYFHFKDKAECFWAVVEAREELRGEWWEEALEGLDPESASLERSWGAPSPISTPATRGTGSAAGRW